MIVYDDVEPSEKIKVYDKGITVTNGLGNGVEPAHDLLVGYRAGDMMAPQISLTEALRVEAQHFVECVRTGRRPLTDGWSGLRVIQVLEAAERSLADSGSPVDLA
jgi:predicted dehydrogenase